MKLVVKNNNGDKFTLQIRPNETFLDLKRRVELESGISLDLRDITSNKRNINEQQKVIDYFLSEQNQVVQNAPAPEVVCAVPTCENKKSTHPDKTYFEFPDEDIRCHQWVLYCRRIASRLSADARSNLPVNVGAPGTAICSDHFKTDQFVKNTTTLLKRTAVPCINPELPSAAPTFTVNRRPVRTPDPKFLSQNILHDSLSSSSNAIVKNSSSASSYISHKPFGTSSTKLTCRLCALPARNTVFIYSREGMNMMLAEKICTSLPIKIKMTDNLPKQVCRPCIERLDTAFYLVEVCTAADDNFKKSDENKRKEMHAKEAMGECPCCADGRLNLAGESDPEGTTLEDRMSLQELFPDHSQEVHEEHQQTVEEREQAEDDGDDADMETGEIVQPIESTGSEQGYVFTDMLDLEGSLNGEEPFACRICGACMRTHGSATDHALSHGIENFFQCILCENYYTGPQELVDHFQSHKAPVQSSPQEDEYEDDDPGVFCEKCGENFSSVLAIPDHNCKPADSEPLPKKCALCPRAFASEHRLQFHMKYHTGSLKGECTTCGKSFPSEWKLYRHMVEEHEAAVNADDQDSDFVAGDEGATNCEECGKSLPSVVALEYHMKSHIKTDGSSTKHLCEWCGKTFIRRSMLRNHITTAHRQAQESSCFTCKICKEAFPTTGHAVSHMDSAHNHYVENEPAYSFEMITVSRLFLCEYCEKVFAEGTVLNKHRELHHSATSPNGATFMCKFCAGSFSSYLDLQEHKSSMHSKHDIPDEYKGEKPNVPVTFLCEFCERVFANYVKYTEHLTIHFGAEPYVCRICGTRFATLDEVTEHRSVHGDVEPLDDLDLNRPFDCHYCDKTFAIEDALVKHIRMHTGEKPFTCEVCGKGFSQSSGLNTHKKVHSDIRPFSCHLCPRTFKIKGDRDVHIRKHSGQRPFKCEFCFKAFMTQHVYSQHRKIHTGERPYRCDVCHVAFRRSHVLTVHKRIHTGEKPNVCDICGKRYRQKGDMLKHRRSQHGILRERDLLQIANAEGLQGDPLASTDLATVPEVAVTAVGEVVSPQGHFMTLN